MDASLPQSLNTSALAGQQAAIKCGSWRRRIIQRLREQPSALFEVAQYFEVPDHTISGRFSELARDLWIERTGERRIKPQTDCAAEVWRVRGDAPELATEAGADRLGYGHAFLIGGDLYDRQPLLPIEGYPGIPYARNADTGGVRLMARVELIECPGCGKPLRQVVEGGKKLFRCGLDSCRQMWSMQLIREPGGPMIPALIMDRFS
jgi:hypothetical protein